MIYRKKTSKIIIPLIIIPVFGILFAAFGSSVLPTKNIECFTQHGACPKSLSDSLTWLINYPLLKPLPGEKIKVALSKYPDVETFHVYRRLPRTLVFGITLRVPVSLISSSVLGSQTVADENGIIFSSASLSGLPVFNISGMPDKLTVDQTKAVSILNQLQSEIKESISGQLSQKTLSITLSNGIIVIVDINQPLSNWVSPLQLILARSKIVAKMPRSIDLRFNNPVIVYPNN
jgi:cell division septal protein FtsQ